MKIGQKTPVTTIDLTPTWEEVASTLAVLFRDGNGQAQQTALDELRRMGRIADAYVAHVKASKTVAECMGG